MRAGAIVALMLGADIPDGHAQTSNRVATVDVEVQMVSFSRKDVEALATSGGGFHIDEARLLELKRKGRATLLFAPRVRTKTGVVTKLKGATDFIYPTTYEVNHGSEPPPLDPYESERPGVSTTGERADSTGFEKREVGIMIGLNASLKIISGRIGLFCVFEWTEFTGSKTFLQRVFSDQDGTSFESSISQPKFYAHSLTTGCEVESGKTVILSGGTPMRDGEQLLYFFITATIVGESDGIAPASGEDAAP